MIFFCKFVPPGQVLLSSFIEITTRDSVMTDYFCEKIRFAHFRNPAISMNFRVSTNFKLPKGLDSQVFV